MGGFTWRYMLLRCMVGKQNTSMDVHRGINAKQ